MTYTLRPAQTRAWVRESGDDAVPGYVVLEINDECYIPVSVMPSGTYDPFVVAGRGEHDGVLSFRDEEDAWAFAAEDRKTRG